MLVLYRGAFLFLAFYGCVEASSELFRFLRRGFVERPERCFFQETKLFPDTFREEKEG